ncbi:MAG: LptF/LptG family permease [Treponema sp.]|nr:LptF/LptG family permease [Treponema sp.]
MNFKLPQNEFSRETGKKLSSIKKSTACAAGIAADFLRLCAETVSDKIDSFQRKYLHKGELRDHVLDRYLLRELLLYFAISFLFFFMVFFVNQILLLAENILKKRVPLWDVIKLITYCLPFIIAQSAPFATLVGFLMCLGRLMSDNEIIIFHASGLGYRILLRPVILLGIVISIASFFVNDYLLPLGTIHYNKLYRSILASNPTVELEPHSVKRLNNSTLIIGNVSGSEVSDLVLFDKGNDNRIRIITAGKSKLVSAKKEGVLMQMSMTDTLALFFDEKRFTDYDVLDSGKVVLNIFDSSFFKSDTTVSPREMTSYDLGRTLQKLKKDSNTNKRTLNLYSLEFNKKFSLPFGSFFFAILALPLALLFGKRNGQTIGMILGIFICVFYWAMMILGQIAASRNGFNAFWSMWIPDLVIGAAGCLFYIRLRQK